MKYAEIEIRNTNRVESCNLSLLKKDSPPNEGVVGCRRLPPRIKQLELLISEHIRSSLGEPNM